MSGRNILFLVLSSVLWICSLVHCHHHSNGGEGNLSRPGLGRVQRSTRQYPDEDEQINEDKNPQIPPRLPSEDDSDSSRRHSDQNAEHSKLNQELVREILQELDRDEHPSDGHRISHPRFHVRHHQRDSQRKDQLAVVRRDDNDVGDGALKITDALEEESELEQQEKPAIGRDESSFGEEGKETKNQASSKSKNQGSRYEGYEYYEGVGIYKFHSEDADSFDEANEICKVEGGHLAIAGSKDEADVLVTLWSKHGPSEGDDAYVGIHNRNEHDVFRTVYGNTLTSSGYVAWRAGEPNNKNGVEHCVSFFRYGGYRDIPCYGPRPFICELRWKNEN